MRKGFTLVEMLVCTAIIVLLSTIAVVALNEARQESFCKEKRITDVEKCQDKWDAHLESLRKG